MQKTGGFLFALCTWLSSCVAEVSHKARQLPYSNRSDILNTKPSPTTPYDPDICRALWISHVEEDIRRISDWVRLWDEVNAWSRGPGKNATPKVFEVERVLTYSWETIPKTVPAPTPELCGVSRFMSVGETTSNYLFTTHLKQVSWDVPRPTDLPLWDVSPDHVTGPIGLPEESLPRPSCGIRSVDCPEQWRLFRAYFANWTTTLDHIDQYAWAKNLVCEGGEGCPPPTNDLDMIRIDFDLFLAWRGYGDLDGHTQTFLEHSFLDGCSPILQNQCWAQSGFSQVGELMYNVSVSTSVTGAQSINTLRPITSIAEIDRGCFVEADQFVLVYFPTISNVSRDVCANDGWGENVPKPALNRTVTKTATLDKIVFESRAQFGKPRSTMYPKDPNSKWTFYDNQIYLAFNTMSASGSCYQPGKTISNHILTLDTTDLSSFVSYKSTTCFTNPRMLDGKVVTEPSCQNYFTYTSRPFNLADLQGPLPERAAYHGWKHEEMAPDANAIIENNYFPLVVLPGQVTKLEPIWASCYPFGDAGTTFKTPKGSGVWDPPIILDGTTSLAAPTITVHGGNGAQTTAAALPGLALSYPNSPVTKHTVGSADFARETAAVKPLNAPSHPNSPESFNSPEADSFPQSMDHPGSVNSLETKSSTGSDNTPGNTPGQQNLHESPPWSPANFAPTAVIMIGKTKVTASAFIDPNSLLFGTQILRAGGPPIKTAGQTVSFGLGGHLQIGAQNFDFPVPTKVLQSNGQMSNSWILPSTSVSTGAGGRSSVPAGSTSIYQVYDDVSGPFRNSRVTPSSWMDATGSTHLTQAAALTGTTKKASRAGRLTDSIPNGILMFGFVAGITLISFPF